MIRSTLFFASCIWIVILTYMFRATMDPKNKLVTRIITLLNLMVVFYMIVERYGW